MSKESGSLNRHEASVNMCFEKLATPGASKWVSKWRGLIAKVGVNLGNLYICVGYSIVFKAFGVGASRKWSFIVSSSGKMYEKAKHTISAEKVEGQCNPGFPVSTPLNTWELRQNITAKDCCPLKSMYFVPDIGFFIRNLDQHLVLKIWYGDFRILIIKVSKLFFYFGAETRLIVWNSNTFG